MLSKIKQNWKSGLTVALVSIPLSISLAVASGVGPVTGIITAIWAGLFASIFAGSAYNIVGPTGALSGLIASFVLAHGVEQASMLAVVSGLLILLAYVLRLERYLVFVPSSVIHGFTLGVACIIALNQLNSALGLHGLPSHERFFDNVVESLTHVRELSWVTLSVFLIFLLGLYAIRRFFPKIPGAIALSPIGILLGYATQMGWSSLTLETLGTRFGQMDFRLFQIPEWTVSWSMVSVGLTVALVAILETMLSARIADGMTHTKHHGRKEMLSLGMANLASGLMGGIPATAALARTALNVKTGANHRISATISSLSIAAISFFLFGMFSYIPMAVIAAILVFAAINMIEMEHFRRFFRYERSGFWVSMAVAIMTVYEDPIVGILAGTAISMLIFMDRLSRGSFRIEDDASSHSSKSIREDASVLLYSIRGKLCYVNSRAHVARFETDFSNYKTVILRMREVYFMDLDGVEALDEIVELCESRGQTVLMSSLQEEARILLESASQHFTLLRRRKRLFEKTGLALESLGIKTPSHK